MFASTGMSLYVIDLAKQELKYVLYLDGMTDINAGSKALSANMNLDESCLVLESKSNTTDCSAFTSYNISGILSTIDTLKQRAAVSHSQEVNEEPLMVTLDNCDVELTSGKAVVHIQPKSIKLNCDPSLSTSVLVAKSNHMITGTTKGELIIWDIMECKVLFMYT